MSDNERDSAPIRIPGRESAARPLPRRFYKTVSVAPAPDGGLVVQLDGRNARTPGRRELAVPSRRLADAIASEWDAAASTIDPAAMPMTRLVNTALDGVVARRQEVAADVVKYAASDLVCYRAGHPAGLVESQKAHWDPVVDWAATRHGTKLVVTQGITYVAQPADALSRLAVSLDGLDAFRLTGVHVMTTLMGSALLSLAVLDRSLTAEAAWAAANVDEDWQIAEWGPDDEAATRRARRWQEMQAAAGLLILLG